MSYFVSLLKQQQRNTAANTGQAMISSVIFFVFIAMILSVGLVTPIVKEFRSVGEVWLSKRSLFVAESGVEDMHYRLLAGLPNLSSGSYTIAVGGDLATVNAGPVISNVRTITSTGDAAKRERVVEFQTTSATSLGFASGVQIGEGGILAQGSSSTIIGNITSSGAVAGSNLNQVVGGSAESAGSSGNVENLRFTSSIHNVHSHTIDNTIISGDAYYTSISNSTVNGVSYPNSPDAPSYPLPITDKMINRMETAAAGGGTYVGTCPYTINTGTVNLGPIKIPCSQFNISGTARVALNGPVWVTGNINIANTARVSVGPGIAVGKSVALIADNTSDRTTSSKISVSTTTDSTGNGTGSYVVLVSQNSDAKNGGSQTATTLISTGSSSPAFIAYAPHGHTDVQGSVILQTIGSYKASLSTVSASLGALNNNVSISFPTGLLNIWEYTQWREI